MQALAHITVHLATTTPTSSGADASTRAVIMAAVLIGLCILLGLIVMAIRKRTLDASNTDAQDDSLLGSLRTMRDTGELSEEEFRQARAQVLSRATGRPAEDFLNNK